MKNKRITDVLFTVGIVVIIAGILGGIIVGMLSGDGFNFIPALAVWLVTFFTGTGIVTVSGSLSEAGEKKQDDAELLDMILEKVKNEEEESQS